MNRQHQPFVIALTGGIGSGKSFIARLFAQHGIAIIDADDIAHDLLATGGAAVDLVSKQFGREYLNATGGIDRERLRGVFHDPHRVAALNRIMHPLIWQKIDQQTAEIKGSPYCIQVVPLLFSRPDWQKHIDRVLVVYCEKEMRIQRVMARSQFDRATVEMIMRQQTSQEELLRYANEVIDNNALPSKPVAIQVADLHQYYLQC